MTWLALQAEIAMEMRSLVMDGWDIVLQRQPRRDESERSAENRAQTQRRIQVLHAVGKVSEARAIENRVRAQKRRRKIEAQAKLASRKAPKGDV